MCRAKSRVMSVPCHVRVETQFESTPLSRLDTRRVHCWAQPYSSYYHYKNKHRLAVPTRVVCLMCFHCITWIKPSRMFSSDQGVQR